MIFGARASAKDGSQKRPEDIEVGKHGQRGAERQVPPFKRDPKCRRESAYQKHAQGQVHKACMEVGEKEADLAHVVYSLVVQLVLLYHFCYHASMHHAYYIEGSQSLFDAYQELLKPFWAEQFERFGIDEARELIEQAQLKNFGGATFFIAAASVPSEAQQALLKLFEEPQPGTMFVLLVPHGTIIPTLRSRMLPYPTTLQIAPKKVLGSAAEFLKSNQKERSAYITKLLKDDDVREPLRELLNGIEAELYALIQKRKGDKALLEGLNDVAKVRSYAGDRSPSFKMLLEHLAIALPTL